MVARNTPSKLSLAQCLRRLPAQKRPHAFLRFCCFQPLSACGGREQGGGALYRLRQGCGIARERGEGASDTERQRVPRDLAP